MIFPPAPEPATTTQSTTVAQSISDGPNVFPAAPESTTTSPPEETQVETETGENISTTGPMIFPGAPTTTLATRSPGATTSTVTTTRTEISPSTDSPISLADEGKCRRAFALCTNTKEAMCFGDIAKKFEKLNHWGWTQVVAEFDVQCDLWVGATNCDTTRGSKIGTATISKSDFEIEILDGFEATNVHFYHGTHQLPTDHRDKNTVGPNYYGVRYPIEEGPKWIIDENSDNSGAFKDFESVPHWIILHITVCKVA